MVKLEQYIHNATQRLLLGESCRTSEQTWAPERRACSLIFRTNSLAVSSNFKVGRRSRE